MKRILLIIAPKFILDWYRIIAEKKALAKSDRLKKKQTISKESIIEVLKSCEIKSDIYLHTSLRKIGYAIEGGKDFIAEVICEVVNMEKHTLLVSALPFSTTMKEFLDSTNILDMRTAPNLMGAVNNIIMKKEGAQRSLHPTHSTVAIGKDADYYVSEHHLDKTPFGKHSPYFKLMEQNGKILLFGVDLDSMTFTHVIEDMMGDLYPVKVYTDDLYNVDVTDINGEVHHVTTTCHNPNVSRSRNCESIRKDLIDGGVMKTIPLGMSEVSIIDAKGYVRVVCELLLQGISIYGKICLSEEGKNKVTEILNSLK